MSSPRFSPGDRVAIFLYDASGTHLGVISGIVDAPPERIDVAGGQGRPRWKTLYRVRDIEGYARPHEDPALAESGTFEPATEGVFSEEDMVEADENGRPLSVPSNPIFRRSLPLS